MRRLLILSLLLSAIPAFAQTATSAARPAEGETMSTPLTREHLLAELSRHVAAHFNLEGELQLELIRPWTPPARLADSWLLDILEFPSIASSSMLIRCRAFGDGEPSSDWTLVVRASLWRDAWAARMPLANGDTFDPSMLEVRRVDLFRERDALPAAVGDRSYALTRAVTAGRLLTWRDVGRRPLVKKGHLVEVSAVEGQLVVTMKALAMENGAQGETVTVRNPESRKDFAAMVVDENRVQVRF